MDTAPGGGSDDDDIYDDDYDGNDDDKFSEMNKKVLRCLPIRHSWVSNMSRVAA